MQIVLNFIIILVAIAGFCIATYIRSKKVKKAPLICPMRTNCDTVIHSDYSKFLGIPVELLGMMYYAIVVISHSMQFLFPELLSPASILAALAFSAIAFLFSMYLTGIQAFILRQWCTWCLFSASFCLVIFFLSYVSYGFFK